MWGEQKIERFDGPAYLERGKEGPVRPACLQIYNWKQRPACSRTSVLWVKAVD